MTGNGCIIKRRTQESKDKVAMIDDQDRTRELRGHKFAFFHHS